MAANSAWDAEKYRSHAPRVGAGKSGSAAATRRMEGAPAPATADGDGPALLGSAVEAVDELATFAAGGAARDGGRLAPAGVQTLLGVEESAPIRSAHDQCRAPRSDLADEPRQSALGRAEDPRRAAEAWPDGVSGDGVEVHAPTSTAAIASVAHVFEESRPGSNRVGFLHGAHRDLSSAVRARDAELRPAAAGAFQCDGASDRGMDGAATARGVCDGGGAPVSASGPRSSLWRTIFASGRDVGHPGGGHCAPLAVAKRVCRAGQLLEACALEAPRYLIRGRDQVYGKRFSRQAKTLDIREAVIAPCSPWQNRMPSG